MNPGYMITDTEFPNDSAYLLLCCNAVGFGSHSGNGRRTRARSRKFWRSFTHGSNGCSDLAGTHSVEACYETSGTYGIATFAACDATSPLRLYRSCVSRAVQRLLQSVLVFALLCGPLLCSAAPE